MDKNREDNVYEVGKGKPPKEHQFTSENQPEKRGRKKSKLKGLIEANDLSSTDISDLVLMLLDKTREELDIISLDVEQPFLIRAFVKSMIKDIDGDSLYNINSLLDRAIGKPKEKKEIDMDMTTKVIFSSEDAGLL
jgi:hypothetical protein